MQALRYYPDYADALNNLALVYDKQGRYQEAVNLLHRSLGIRNSEVERRNLASILDDWSAALLGAGRLDEAEVRCREALGMYPADSAALNNLGVVYNKRSNYDQAAGYFRRALAADPTNGAARQNLASIEKFFAERERDNAINAAWDRASKAYDAKNYARAITDYQEVLRLNPNDEAAHYNLGLALKEIGNITAAIDQFRTAVQLNPNDPDARNMLASIGKEKRDNAIHAVWDRASNAYDAKNYTQAITDYREVLRLDPSDFAARLHLAAALEEAGNYAEAIDAYREMLRRDPSDAYARTKLANALGASEDLAAAETEYRNLAKAGDITSAKADENIANMYNDNMLQRAAKVQGDAKLAVWTEHLQKFPDIRGNGARWELANYLSEKGNHTDAETVYRDALKYDPGNASLNIKLAHALAKQGRWQEAGVYAEKGKQADPKAAEEISKHNNSPLRPLDPLNKAVDDSEKWVARSISKGIAMGTNFFGAKNSNPSSADLGPSASAPPPGSDTNARRQLQSVQENPNTSGGAQEGIDTTGKAPTHAPAPVDVPSANPIETPVSREVANNPEYRALDAARKKAEGDAAAAQRNIDALKAQQNNATSQNEREQLQIQIAKEDQTRQAARSTAADDRIKQDEVKKKLADLSRPLEDEAPEQPSGAAPSPASSQSGR